MEMEGAAAFFKERRTPVPLDVGQVRHVSGEGELDECEDDAQISTDDPSSSCDRGRLERASDAVAERKNVHRVAFTNHVKPKYALLVS